MNPKSEIQDLTVYVQKWVAVDNQLKTMNEKTKSLRDWRHKLTDSICQIMNENKWKDRILEIPDGELKYCERKDYGSLTYSYVETCLKEIIKDDTQVEYIIQYLKDHRETKMIPDLKRTIRGEKSINNSQEKNKTDNI